MNEGDSDVGKQAKQWTSLKRHRVGHYGICRCSIAWKTNTRKNTGPAAKRGQRRRCAARACVALNDGGG